MKWKTKILLLLFIPVCLSAAGQVKKQFFSEPFRKDAGLYEVIGKWGTDYLIFENKIKEQKYLIHHYGPEMKLIASVPVANIPAGAYNFHFIKYESTLYLIYFYKHRNKVICESYSFNRQLKMQEKPIALGQFNSIDNLKSIQQIRLKWSHDKSKILLWQISVLNGKEASIVTTIFNSSLHTIHQSETKFKVKNMYESEIDPVISDEGNIYFTINPYSSFDNFEYAYKAFSDVDYKVSQVKLNNKFIQGDFKIDLDNANRKLYLNAFYTEKEDSYGIKGVATFFIKEDQPFKIEVKFNPFNPESISKIKGDRSLDSIESRLSIRETFIKNDGSFVLMVEIIRKDLFRRNPVAPRNPGYDYGEMFNPYSRDPFAPQGIYYPDSKLGNAGKVL